jgi:protein TonB
MDFTEDSKMSVNRMIGIGLVILLHVLLVYVLVSGLATSAIDVIKKPLEIKIIQAAAPPPPPPVMTPPPPKLTIPPPPYIPPPLIQVQQPTPPPPVFAVTTTAKPPPPAPMHAAPAPAAPAPSSSVTAVCPNVGSIAGQLQDGFQDIANNDGIDSATVVVGFTVSADGVISGAHIVSSSAADVDGLALQGVQGLRCEGQGQAIEILAPFKFSTQ